jgi:HK97 family phage prohead protease
MTISEREIPCIREFGEQPAIVGEYLEGYAIVFNQRSHKISDHHGTYVETIDPDAFDLTKNITFNYRHDDNAEYGSTASGTLTLTKDDKGIRFRLALPAYAQTLRTQIANGHVRGMSFGFYPNKIEWRDGIRHVLKGELLHISAVINPAYPQTNVEIRKPSLDVKRKQLALISKL